MARTNQLDPYLEELEREPEECIVALESPEISRKSRWMRVKEKLRWAPAATLVIVLAMLLMSATAVGIALGGAFDEGNTFEQTTNKTHPPHGTHAPHAPHPPHGTHPPHDHSGTNAPHPPHAPHGTHPAHNPNETPAPHSPHSPHGTHAPHSPHGAHTHHPAHETSTDAPTPATDNSTFQPTSSPSASTEAPSESPTDAPTEAPSEALTSLPTFAPSEVPSTAPVDQITGTTSETPSQLPTISPTVLHTALPSQTPTANLSGTPTSVPTVPTTAPSASTSSPAPKNGTCSVEEWSDCLGREQVDCIANCQWIPPPNVPFIGTLNLTGQCGPASCGAPFNFSNSSEAQFNSSAFFFEGDMIVSYDQISLYYGQDLADYLVARGALDSPSSSSRRLQDTTPLNDKSAPWFCDCKREQIAIGYEYHSSFDTFKNANIEYERGDIKSETAEEQLLRNLREIENDSNDGVKFINRADTNYPPQNDYDCYVRGLPMIEFFTNGYCASPVGRHRRPEEEGGVPYFKTPVFLSANCMVTQAIAAHEVFHALGFWHEHSRSDRDEYVDFTPGTSFLLGTNNFLNQLGISIDGLELFALNYQKQEGKNPGEYDYESVMHYGYDEGIAGKKPGSDALINKNRVEYFSKGDLEDLSGPVADLCTTESSAFCECTRDSDCSGTTPICLGGRCRQGLPEPCPCCKVHTLGSVPASSGVTCPFLFLQGFMLFKLPPAVFADVELKLITQVTLTVIPYPNCGTCTACVSQVIHIFDIIGDFNVGRLIFRKDEFRQAKTFDVTGPFLDLINQRILRNETNRLVRFNVFPVTLDTSVILYGGPSGSQTLQGPYLEFEYLQ